jgi:hypothetical protein
MLFYSAGLSWPVCLPIPLRPMPRENTRSTSYVHIAHHRGQAEIYLRDKGIRPPPYGI